MPAEKPCWSVGCGLGCGGRGGHVSGWHPMATLLLAPRSHLFALTLQIPALPRPPFFLQPPRAQLSNPLPPPPPSSPHLDQLDVRFEPLQAGLQGAQ